MFDFHLSHTPGRLLLCWMLLVSAYPLHAADDDSDLSYMTLNGLQSLAVEVAGIERDFERFGLTSDLVLANAVEELRNTGLDVVDRSAFRKNPGTALMRIKINTNENQFQFYMYGVSIELKQKIPLNNPAGGYISGTIWKDGQTGIVMPMDLRQLNDIVVELLAGFVKEYRAQNPQTLPGTG